MARLTKLIGGEWRENHDDDTKRWQNGNRACMNKLGVYENLLERWHLKDTDELDRILHRINRLGGTDLFASYKRIGTVEQFQELMNTQCHNCDCFGEDARCQCEESSFYGRLVEDNDFCSYFGKMEDKKQ